MSQQNKDKIIQRSKLLQQKILTNTQIIQNIQQYEIEQLNNKQNILLNQIQNYLTQLSAQISKIGSNYDSFLKQINNRLDQNQSNTKDQIKTFHSVNPQILTITQIKQYLNVQKKVMKQLVESYQSGIAMGNNNNDQYTKQKLHTLAKKKKLQLILQSIQQQQLLKQIKYLQEDILGASTSNKGQQIIYIPDSHITNKQEQQINDKIKLLIEELERLINLQAICAQQQTNKTSNKDKQTDNYIQILNKQYQRLQKTQQLINQDLQGFLRVQKYVQQFDHFLADVPGYSTRYQGYINQNMIKNIGKKYETQQLLEEEQQNIQQILDFKIGEIVGSRTCNQQELNAILKVVKNRAKKMGI